MEPPGLGGEVPVELLHLVHEGRRETLAATGNLNHQALTLPDRDRELLQRTGDPKGVLCIQSSRLNAGGKDIP